MSVPGNILKCSWHDVCVGGTQFSTYQTKYKKILLKGPVKLSNEYKSNILKGLFKNTVKMKSKYYKVENKAMNSLFHFTKT